MYQSLLQNQQLVQKKGVTRLLAYHMFVIANIITQMLNIS